ncbi:MAG: T9SS type A sorting domain-containing protein [Bacteroidota bacterium]
MNIILPSIRSIASISLLIITIIGVRGGMFACTLESPLHEGESYTEMIHLEVKRASRNAEIKWGLLNPVELPHHFEVQRSLDGLHFQTIHEALAQAQESYLEYNFLDEGIMDQGLSAAFYRIKQVAKDGTPSHSHIIELSLSEEIVVVLSLYPNPADTRLYAQYTLRNATGKKLSISNGLGKTHWTSPAIEEGMHTEAIDVSQWPAGIYYFQLRHASGKQVQKFVVK